MESQQIGTLSFYRLLRDEALAMGYPHVVALVRTDQARFYGFYSKDKAMDFYQSCEGSVTERPYLLKGSSD